MSRSTQFVLVVFAAAALSSATVLAQETEGYRPQVAKPASKPPLHAVTNVGGGGTSGKIAKWSDNANNLGDSIMTEQNGWIGIGLPNGTAPTTLLHLYGIGTTDIFAGMGPDTTVGPSFNYGYSGATFGRGSGFFNVRPDASAIAPNPSLRFMVGNVQRMIITNSGKIGIGNSASNYNPAYNLEVTGTAHVTGDMTVDGNLAALYQDVAEWVPSNGRLPAGTVVVISSGKTNEVAPSQKAYDTRIAGVVSPQPGLSLGKRGDEKSQVATVGRVKVRVDATKAPINTGDLLVSSDTPGMAMKSQPFNVSGIELHRPGTLLGKALEPLASGHGEILVLLSMQ